MIIQTTKTVNKIDTDIINFNVEHGQPAYFDHSHSSHSSVISKILFERGKKGFTCTLNSWLKRRVLNQYWLAYDESTSSSTIYIRMASGVKHFCVTVSVLLYNIVSTSVIRYSTINLGEIYSIKKLSTYGGIWRIWLKLILHTCFDETRMNTFLLFSVTANIMYISLHTFFIFEVNLHWDN
jgi:hypothetical protein